MRPVDSTRRLTPPVRRECLTQIPHLRTIGNILHVPATELPLVAKHGKPDGGNTPADLRRRVEKARSESRFQTALDLAKQLYKYAPTPENRDLLFRVHIGRAGQLRD